MKKLFIFLFFLLFLSKVNYADVGVSGGKRQDIQTGKEKSLSKEKVEEQKQTRTRRKEARKEKTIKKSLQQTIKKSLSQKDDSSFKITISSSELFYNILAEEEKKGQKPFSICKLITRPPTLKDIGINFEDNGIIDVIAKEYYQAKAEAGGVVDINRKEVKRIVFCALEYSRILGSANLKLSKIKDFQDWLGLKDLKKYARIAILQSIKKTDETVKELITTAKDVFSFPCRLRRNLDTLLCGAIGIELRPSLQLFLGKQQIYGNQFLFNSEWTISSIYSLDKTWEKIKSLAKDSSKIQSISRNIERLESEGNLRKATLMKKKTIQAILDNRFDLNVSPK